MSKHPHRNTDELEKEVKEAMSALDTTCSVLRQAGMDHAVVSSAMLNLLFIHACSKNGKHTYDPCADHELVTAAMQFAHARLHKHLGSDE